MVRIERFCTAGKPEGRSAWDPQTIAALRQLWDFAGSHSTFENAMSRMVVDDGGRVEHV